MFVNAPASDDCEDNHDSQEDNKASPDDDEREVGLCHQGCHRSADLWTIQMFRMFQIVTQHKPWRDICFQDQPGSAPDKRILPASPHLLQTESPVRISLLEQEQL